MALEGGFLRKRAEQIRNPLGTVAPVAPEAETNEPTLQEIFQNDNQGFGEMLASSKNSKLEGMGARFISGESTEADMAELVKQRTEYLDRKSRAEKLSSTLHDYYGDLKERSEPFKQFCETFGDQNVQNTLKQGLAEMVLKDPDQFKKIETYYKKIEDFEEKVEKPFNKRIADFCDKHRLTEEELLKSFSHDDPTLREYTIRASIREKMGMFEAFGDSLRSMRGKGSREAAQRMSMDKNYQDLIIADREKDLKNAGAYLSALISKNPELRGALVRTQLGEQPTFKEGIGTKMSFDQAKGLNEASDVNDISRGWTKYKLDRNIQMNKVKDDTARDAIRSQFMKRYANEKIKDTKGFWASVVEFIFANSWKKDKKIKDVLN